MSMVHLARQGFITKSALPNVTRQRGTTTAESNLMLYGAGKTTVSNNTTFIDSSANAFTVTRNGDTVQSGFNPFSGVSYGSGYFDGTGDSLSVASNAAFDILSGGDFTVECWFYATSLPSNSGFGSALISRDNAGSTAGFIFRVLPTSLQWVYPGLAANTQSFTFVVNTWYHVAAVRLSGVFSLYINGTKYNPTYSDRTADSATALLVGASAYTTNTASFTGYSSNARVVKGTAVYTSNFTPPTAPLTAITNTQLLLLTDNYSVVNSTSSNLLVTVTGSAPISTAQYPSGMSSSIYFAGSGNSLAMSATAGMNFGTGDWTMEAYVYISADSPLDGLNRRFALICEVNNNGGFYINGDASVTGTGLTVYNATTGVAASVTTTITKNAWHHLAVSRIGSFAYFFVDGTLISTGQTISGNWGSSTQTLRVAQVGTGSFSYPLTGYVSNLRITKGTGLYATNFTPSAPLSITFTVPNSVTNSIYGVYQLA